MCGNRAFHKTKWSVVPVPLSLFRRLAARRVRWMFTAEPSRRFAAKLKVWGQLGEIQECYRLAHPETAKTNSTSVSLDLK